MMKSWGEAWLWGGGKCGGPWLHEADVLSRGDTVRDTGGSVGGDGGSEWCSHSQETQIFLANHQKLGRGKGRFLRYFRGRMAHLMPLFWISDLWNHETIHFCCFMLLSVLLCYSSPRKLIQMHWKDCPQMGISNMVDLNQLRPLIQSFAGQS